MVTTTTKVILDLPDEVNKKVSMYMVALDTTSKAKTIIKMLEKLPPLELTEKETGILSKFR